MLPLLKQNIRTLVKERRLTYSVIERDAGLNRNFISNFISEKKLRYPGIDAIAKIATTLGVSIDDLIGNESSSIKSHNLTITNNELFCKVLEHLIGVLKTKQGASFEISKVFNAICEIYKYSLKDGSFNEEFADWFAKQAKSKL